jgi:hypothetical protein
MAIAEYQAAIQLYPKYVEAHNSLGLVITSSASYRWGSLNFKAAIHIDSKLAAAGYNLGLALRDVAISSTAGEERAKLLEDSCRAFAEASKLAPDAAKYVGYADRMPEIDSLMNGRGHCPPT